MAQLPDLIAPGLTVLFCGINPGACAAERGHHFLGRGKRFRLRPGAVGRARGPKCGARPKVDRFVHRPCA